MARAAAGLKAQVPSIDVVATSPLVRAVQTAEIVATEYGDVEPIQIQELRPESDSVRLARWLGDQVDDSTIALVGHEPSLSFHVSWLTARADDAFVEFKKGGICLLRFYQGVHSGGATLRWMMTPKQLRSLGE
jgi:phosphohistidine phosphatase